MALVVKAPPVNSGDPRDTDLIPESGRCPGGGHDNPLQYSCLENSMAREVRRTTVYGVAKESEMTEQINNNNNVSIYTAREGRVP